MSAQRRVALLSVGAGVTTLLLKIGAYLLTGSVGLLSDAAESAVNLAAALAAFAAVSIAGKPPDERHPYGHEKVEYFSSGLEGGLIVVAAAGIIYTAVDRLLHPVPLQRVESGLAVAVLASAINFAVARVLLRVGQREDSIALEADAHHLMTDVWTSVGVVAGVAAVAVTGWYILDPLIALAVATNIVRVGFDLMRRSVEGLMDRALPEEEIARIREAIAEAAGPETPYHGLRTRKAGARRFVDLHLLVPGTMTVQEAHDLVERVEQAIHRRLPNVQITVHVEPLEDRASWDADAVGGLAHPEDEGTDIRW